MSDDLVPGVDYDEACCPNCGATGPCADPFACMDSILGPIHGFYDEDEREPNIVDDIAAWMMSDRGERAATWLGYGAALFLIGYLVAHVVAQLVF